jgi:hypothetical protein
LTNKKKFVIINLENEREEKDMMIYGDKDTIIVKKDCPFCGLECMCYVPAKGYDAWKKGALIQKALPTVPATTREWLISGICPDCQEKMFGEEV